MEDSHAATETVYGANDIDTPDRTDTPPSVEPSVLPPVPAPVKLPVPGVPASPETKLVDSEYTRFRGRGKYRAWA